MPARYEIQVGTGGTYRTRWKFSKFRQAVLYYDSLNCFPPHKKRLLRNGRIIAGQDDLQLTLEGV